MDIQTIIVSLIILAALVYVGKMVWAKTRAFSGKKSCGTDCGCEGKQARQTLKTRL